MEMKMTFFINDKDDVEKAMLKMVINGQSFDSDVVFEYDIEVTLKPPPPPAEKKD